MLFRSDGTDDITQPVTARLSSDGGLSFGNGGVISFPASPSKPLRLGESRTGTITVRLN